MLGMTGFRTVTAPTFVPAYIYLLSGSKLVVGCVLSAQYAGMALSSIWGATQIEHRQRVMPLIYGRLDGTPADPRAGAVGLPAVGLPGAGGGGRLPAAVRPVQRRAERHLQLPDLEDHPAGPAWCADRAPQLPRRPDRRRGGWLGGELLVGRNVFGNGYATTFLCAFILTSLGISALTRMREPALHDVHAPSGFGKRLRELPALLRRTRTTCASSGARAGGPQHDGGALLRHLRRHPYPAFGRHPGLPQHGLPDGPDHQQLAWGWLADRRGYRVVFLASIGLWAAATAALLLCEARWAFLLVFCGLGAGFGGYFLASDNFALEFGRRKDRRCCSRCRIPRPTR